MRDDQDDAVGGEVFVGRELMVKRTGRSGMIRRDGEEAPMRFPISPPTREAFNLPDLTIMCGLGMVDRLGRGEF